MSFPADLPRQGRTPTRLICPILDHFIASRPVGVIGSNPVPPTSVVVKYDLLFLIVQG